MADLEWGMGIDIGGTNARVARVEPSGRIIGSAKAPLTDHSPAGVVASIAGLVRQLGGAVPAHVGVGFAGMLRGWVVVNAPNFGWRNVDLGTPLAAALGARVTLLNDLSAAAWGERMAGVARGCDDTFTVFVGTGVGSAIISAGHLVRGATQVAAEFGHLKVVAEGGRRCGCGEDGCLEAYMGGAKLLEWMKESQLDGTIADLEQRALGGDPRSRELYDFAVGHLALAIANQVTVLNPRMVVLGGGVLARCPGIVARVRDVVSRRSGAAARAGLEVATAALGDDSGLVGAALLAG
jgi:glucokinase